MWKVQIPKTESIVEEATLMKWHKKERDRINKGELIAEVETFKAVVEIHSPDTGIIYKIIVEEGETVPVNTIIALIIEEGEEISSESIKPFLRNQKEESVSLKKEEISFPKHDLPHSSDIKNEKIKIAPIARKLALEKELDLSLIDGSGPGGVITKKDIEKYLLKKEKKTSFTVREICELNRVQKISSEKLTYSYKNIPQFTLFRKINISSLLVLRNNLNVQSEQHLSLIDFVIKALVLAFKKYPTFNAIFEKEKYKIIKDININLAIATDRGLMDPVLKNLEEKNIFKIAQIRRDITDKTLKGKLKAQDYEGGTFTITNLGLQEIEYFTPIINPPQVAILGIGKSDSCLPLSLTVDHRVIDGAKGAAFLQFLSEILSSSNLLLQD